MIISLKESAISGKPEQSVIIVENGNRVEILCKSNAHAEFLFNLLLGLKEKGFIVSMETSLESESEE